jgi:A/G-specific adenine glycosylase
VPTADIGVVVVHANGRILLQKRPPEGLLAGMWAFPEADGVTASEAQALVRDLGMEPAGSVARLEVVRHRFTHLEARYHPWSIEVAARSASEDPRCVWVDPTDPGERALPRAQQKVLTSWLREHRESS